MTKEITFLLREASFDDRLSSNQTAVAGGASSSGETRLYWISAQLESPTCCSSASFFRSLVMFSNKGGVWSLEVELSSKKGLSERDNSREDWRLITKKQPEARMS